MLHDIEGHITHSWQWPHLQLHSVPRSLGGARYEAQLCRVECVFAPRLRPRIIDCLVFGPHFECAAFVASAHKVTMEPFDFNLAITDVIAHPTDTASLIANGEFAPCAPNPIPASV